MYKLGIDLGGTNIVAGVVDENYKIIATAKRKTNCPRPAEEIVADMAAAALEAVENAGLKLQDIEAAGVGSPGSIDPENGMVCTSNNLDFTMVPLAQMLKDKTGIDFYLENDANAAAYGEFIAGAGKGAKNFIMITLGTGVGGGIIINGKIYSGSDFAGGELGHTVILADGEGCTCGRKGCWEAYASATALIRQTKRKMAECKDSKMWELVNGDINAVSGRTSFDAMRQGDKAGAEVADQYIKYISIGIANNINIFRPEILAIGGGISKEGDNLLVPLREKLKGNIFAYNSKMQTEVVAAKLGNDAGIIGAAYICDLYK